MRFSLAVNAGESRSNGLFCAASSTARTAWCQALDAWVWAPGATGQLGSVLAIAADITCPECLSFLLFFPARPAPRRNDKEVLQ